MYSSVHFFLFFLHSLRGMLVAFVYSHPHILECLGVPSCSGMLHSLTYIYSLRCMIPKDQFVVRTGAARRLLRGNYGLV